MDIGKSPFLSHTWAIMCSPLKFAWNFNVQYRITYRSLMLKVGVAREHNGQEWQPIPK